MSQDYIFQLGRLPDISLRELESLLPPKTELTPVFAGYVKVSGVEYALVDEVFERSGGSLKLLQCEGEFTEVSEEQLFEYVVAYFAQFDRPTFSIAEIGREPLPRIPLQQVKNALKARGVSTRFIDSPREGLSASVLLHQGVTELSIIQTDEKIVFARTMNIQDIDHWTKRDRYKPYANRKKGMLPPKLARIMINFAQPYVKNKVLCDPFCGTGTVLAEAALLGNTTFGADLDMDAVEGSTKNMEWLTSEYSISPAWKVFQMDATKISLDNLNQKMGVIVTEPFLGKPKPTEIQLPGIFRGLEKQYLGCFKQWTKILEDDATVVIVLPYTKAGGQIYSLEKIIDKIVQFGYTSRSSPVMYYRPDAVIQRQIWTLGFKKAEK